MNRTKRYLADAVAAAAVCCMILSCLAVGEQTVFGDPDPEVSCANNPACVISGEDPQRICGNPESGGGCDPDPNHQACTCKFNVGMLCVCKN